MPALSARALDAWDDVRSSYWFIPSLMTLGAVVLALVLTEVDRGLGPEWVETVAFLREGNKPDGARSFLSTVAGSMIGVAGVTFSITIASVVYATGQYGPRLLSNFMDDRGNQVTLGTFIATFLYCLLVLRTIRSAEEGGGAAMGGGEFVPHVAILVGLGLTLASVGVFIFFIHHVPESIHVSNLVAGVGRDLLGRTETLFPERIGGGPTTRDADEDGDAEASLPDGFFEDARRVRSGTAGYVRGIDSDALLELATRHDLVVRVRHRPGDFAAEGDPLVLAWPPGRATDEAADEICTAFAWGAQRSARQDVRFLVNELVEIAARALSPGVKRPVHGHLVPRLAERGPEGARRPRLPRAGPLRRRRRPPRRGRADPRSASSSRPSTASSAPTSPPTGTRRSTRSGRSARWPAGPRSPRSGRTSGPRPTRSSRGPADALTLDADRRDVRDRHREVSRILSGQDDLETVAAETDAIGGTALTAPPARPHAKCERGGQRSPMRRMAKLGFSVSTAVTATSSQSWATQNSWTASITPYRFPATQLPTR